MILERNDLPEIYQSYEDWYEFLPKGYKELALANLNPQKKEDKALVLPQAIAQGFLWNRTPEGYEFWMEVQQHYVWQPQVITGTGKKRKVIPAHYPELPKLP